jgi:hypothetical protein
MLMTLVSITGLRDTAYLWTQTAVGTELGGGDGRTSAWHPPSARFPAAWLTSRSVAMNSILF